MLPGQGLGVPVFASVPQAEVDQLVFGLDAEHLAAAWQVRLRVMAGLPVAFAVRV
jgi:hypothetical protein